MREIISRAEVVDLLIGKTIVAVGHSDSMSRHLNIESLTLCDGTMVQLSGNHDEAHAWSIALPNGESLLIQDDLGY